MLYEHILLQKRFKCCILVYYTKYIHQTVVQQQSIHYVYVSLPKPKKFGCVGREDLTLLFKSCEIDESQGRLVY